MEKFKLISRSGLIIVSYRLVRLTGPRKSLNLTKFNYFYPSREPKMKREGGEYLSRRN